MSRYVRVFREHPRVNYLEPEEPAFDDYIFCEECTDYVYEYCAIHGPLLVIPDTKVSYKPNIPAIVPRAALTIPRVFLHLARSIIPGAGIGVFSTLTLPRGVRFGPYRGQRAPSPDSMYCWQIYDRERRRAHVVDASDAQRSNWMRYVNCARHWSEQNLVAFQYRGELYYRTIKIIPRFTELLVFYGSEYANTLGVNLGAYNAPLGYAAKFGAPVLKQELPQLDAQTKTISNNFQLNELEIGTERNIITDEKIHTNYNNRSIKEIIENNSSTTYQNLNICDNKNPSMCNFSDKNINLGNLFANADERLHKCDICQKCFSLRTYLKRHLRIHKGKKQFICDFCKKCFSEKIYLMFHIPTHTAEKPYKCDICQKRFSYRNILKRHLRIHTDEKPYICDICQKCYKQKYILYRHLRIHKDKKQFICDFCKKCFSDKTYLIYHMCAHTSEKSYVCDVCQKRFTQRCRLNCHLRTHTGEKRHKCDICEKCFGTKFYLNIHRRIHTGEKPYKCDICNNCFMRKDALRTHIRIHFKNK